MWPDRVSNPGPLTYESGALSTALRGPTVCVCVCVCCVCLFHFCYEGGIWDVTALQRTLVITTVFVTKDIAVKSNLLL